MQRTEEADAAGTAKRAVASDNWRADGKRRRVSFNLKSYEESDDDDSIYESDLQCFANAVDKLKAEEEEFHQRQQMKFLDLKNMICDMRDRCSRRKWKRISHAKKEFEALSRDLVDDGIEGFEDGGRIEKFGNGGKNGGGLKEYTRTVEKERVEESFGSGTMGNKSSTPVSPGTSEVPLEAGVRVPPLVRSRTAVTESPLFNPDVEASATTPAAALPNKPTTESPRNNRISANSIEIKMEIMAEAPDFRFGTPASPSPDIQRHIAGSSPQKTSMPRAARISATSSPEAHAPVRRNNSTHENSRPGPQVPGGNNGPFEMGIDAPRLETRVRRTKDGTAPLRSIEKINYQEVFPEPLEPLKPPIHPTKRRKGTHARRESSSKNGPDDSYTEDKELDKDHEKVARPEKSPNKFKVDEKVASEKSPKKLKVDSNQSLLPSYFQRTPVKPPTVAGPSRTRSHPEEKENGKGK
ncbi:hypothetical protein RUND412_001931 [Rhizina undulata]